MARPSFAEAARPHLGWLSSLARRLLGDPDDADDVLQTALLGACRSFDDVRDVEALPAWLERILVNCCRDHWRSVGRRPDETSLDGLDGPTRDRVLAREEPVPFSDPVHVDFVSSLCVDDVWEVLDRLETIYREPLLLVHMGGYTTAEVAESLSVPRNTILSRLHRGRKRFANELRAYARERDLLRREPTQ